MATCQNSVGSAQGDVITCIHFPHCWPLNRESLVTVEIRAPMDCQGRGPLIRRCDIFLKLDKLLKKRAWLQVIWDSAILMLRHCN